MAKKKKDKKRINLLSLLRKKWWIIGLTLFLIVFINKLSGGLFLSISKMLKLSSPSVTPVLTPSDSFITFPPVRSFFSKEDYINLVVDDLEKKLKVSKDKIKLVKIEEVRWKDTSLGCAQNDKFYTQVITPGYRITFSVYGKEFIYNAGSNRVAFCGKSQ